MFENQILGRTINENNSYAKTGFLSSDRILANNQYSMVNSGDMASYIYILI